MGALGAHEPGGGARGGGPGGGPGRTGKCPGGACSALPLGGPGGPGGAGPGAGPGVGPGVAAADGAGAEDFFAKPLRLASSGDATSATVDLAGTALFEIDAAALLGEAGAGTAGAAGAAGTAGAVTAFGAIFRFLGSSLTLSAFWRS